MVARKIPHDVLLVLFGLSAVLLTGCSPSPRPATFELHVLPVAIADLAQDASCIFLVSATETGLGEGVDEFVSLDIDGSAGFVVAPARLEMGEVGEIRLWGVDVEVGTTVTITVTARRGDEAQTATVSAAVTEPIGPADDRLVTGAEMRDLFLPWLISEHSELGVTSSTSWTPLPVRPHILEVSYCMFLSDEWEMVVWWHVMIPPYDWTRMYLRHRDSEIAPSFAAEISSRAVGGAPHAITPPDEVWR